jgi:hypothetical protein
MNLPDEQGEAILGQVLDALDKMVQLSCIDMLPLWLRASLRVRQDLLKRPLKAPEYPGHLAGRSHRGSQTKYKALAGWRHVVVWREALSRLEDLGCPDALNALKMVYFQPYPRNKPPYSFSRKTSAAPGFPVGQDVETVRAFAERGIIETLKILLKDRESLQGNGDGRELDVLELGLKKSLVDVLKLEESSDVPEWTNE